MKVPQKVKNKALQIARHAQKQRELNIELSKMLDELGVDTSGAKGSEFFDVIGYLEGDCDPQPLLQYLESL